MTTFYILIEVNIFVPIYIFSRVKQNHDSNNSNWTLFVLYNMLFIFLFPVNMHLIQKNMSFLILTFADKLDLCLKNNAKKIVAWWWGDK